MNGLLTVPEVAKIMRVSLGTVHRWIKVGKLPAFKPGEYKQGDKGHWRVQRVDLEAFFKE